MVANIRGFTPNYNFKLINFDTPRWHTLEYANWNMLDVLLLQQGAPQSRGYWLNSVNYIAGDRVFDVDSGSMYRCLEDHTSASTGSFAEDRAARPTLWTFQIIAVPVYRGEWLPNVSYIVGDIVVVGQYSYYLCTQQHISSVDFSADTANWQLIFSTSEAVDAIDVSVDEADASADSAAASAADAAGYASSAAISADAAIVSMINWEGIWSASANYKISDAVEYQGTSYIARTANVGKQPDISPSDWDLMAQRGSAGPAGSGSGDMLRSQNLADVLDPAVSLANIGGVNKTYVDTQNTTQNTTFNAALATVNSDIDAVETAVSARVLKNGDTMGGPLILPAAAPTDPNQAVSKSYVDNNSSSVTVGTVAPSSPKVGSLWWESDTGLLYIYYNDGDSSQWVIASPMPDFSGSFVSKAGDTMTGHLTLPTSPAASNAVRKDYVDNAIGSAATDKVNRVGDTMTGPLVLAANPSAALGAATKQYVDNFHTRFTNALAADVLLNNTTNYFDGPTVAQGTSGVWFASGTVTVVDTTASAAFIAKLWDGTTVVASAYDVSFQQNFGMALSLSGIFVNPTGNIRISCRDIGTTAGRISANLTQNGNKDSSLSVFRIG